MAKGLGLFGAAPQQTTQEKNQEPKKQTKPTAAPMAEPEPQQEPQMVAAGVRKSTQGRKAGRKATTTEHTDSVKAGLQDGYTRATIIAKIETVDKMKEIAWQQHTTFKDIIEQVLADYIAKYEKKNGAIKIVY